MSNKRRKAKKKPTKSLPESWMHAERIIRTNGYNMALIDGTMLDQMKVIGMRELNDKHKLRYRQLDYDGVTEVLKHCPRTWTCVWAYIMEEGDELIVESDYCHFQNFTLMDCKLAALNTAREEWNNMLVNQSERNYIGMVWLAIPTRSENAEEMLGVFDEYLESQGAFDPMVCKLALPNSIIHQVNSELERLSGEEKPAISDVSDAILKAKKAPAIEDAVLAE